MVDLQLKTTVSVTQPWQGGLAPALPPPAHPKLSLAYRLCLPACQPWGRDSFLFWYAVKKYSSTFSAAKLWGRQNQGRAVKGTKKKITTCLAWCQIRKATGLKRAATPFPSLGPFVGCYWCNWPTWTQGGIKVVKAFLFLQNEDISESSWVVHMCCKVNLLIVSKE